MNTINKDILDEMRQQAKIRKSIMWNIDRLNSEINSIRDIGTGIIEQERVQHNRFSDPTAEKAIKIITKYGERLGRLQDDLMDIDKKIDMINSTLNSLYAQKVVNGIEFKIIKHYYIDALTIGEIAVIMNYSEIWIKQVKAKAVDKLCAMAGKFAAVSQDNAV